MGDNSQWNTGGLSVELLQDISNWIRQQVENAGEKGVVVGLSGGIDSSVAAELSKKALGIDEELAMKFAKEFGIKTKKIGLTALFDYLKGVCSCSNDIARANLKPRLRMLVLYYFANSLDYLVAGTGNKSELTIGYFTKYGDGGCDILPLGGLLKTEVRNMAKELKVPSEIIERPSTAGLWGRQIDEKEIDISYEDLDNVIKAIEEDNLSNVKKKDLRKTQLMIKKSNHKREKILIFLRR